jgi:hypothetical protein
MKTLGPAWARLLERHYGITLEPEHQRMLNEALSVPEPEPQR